MPFNPQQQLHKVFPGDQSFQDYDPELQGPNRHRGLQARLSQQQLPLKSALKAPKQPPTAYVNQAFISEDGEDGDGDGGGGGGLRTSFAPEEPVAVTAPAPVAAATELNKMPIEEEKQPPGFELPRVEALVKPVAAPESRLFSMNADG